MSRNPERRGVPLDGVSTAIIDQLREDGRRSYSAIGKVVGMSEAAVRQRVQRLIDGGVMQVVALTDPQEMGLDRQAMVGVRVTGPPAPVADEIAAIDELDHVVLTAGSFDILAEAVCADDEHLLGVVSDRIRAIEGVAATETFLYLAERKQGHTWGAH